MTDNACYMKYKRKYPLYLSMSRLNVQNVSLGCGPVEGEVWYSIAKGKGCLTIGQTHYIHGHLDH